jgi:hypothetical protein
MFRKSIEKIEPHFGMPTPTATPTRPSVYNPSELIFHIQFDAEVNTYCVYFVREGVPVLFVDRMRYRSSVDQMVCEGIRRLAGEGIPIAVIDDQGLWKEWIKKRHFYREGKNVIPPHKSY